ncbi:hypothetical protein [Streptomyces sp. NBC_01518]|uniref:hypothetical protein n=1 Tax=Streptomyces sp. NBC_01518 TaxID=2903891 RepID=UPI00386FE47E
MTTNVVRPTLTPRTRSAIASSATVSTAVVGSCRTSTGGRAASARPSATRWR